MFFLKCVFCLKLDAKSVPEALATSIRILLMFSIVLAHSRAEIPTFSTKWLRIPVSPETTFRRPKWNYSRSKSLIVRISSPEALATSIRILLMFSIVLAHSRNQIPSFCVNPFFCPGIPNKKAAKTRVAQNGFLTSKIYFLYQKRILPKTRHQVRPRSSRHIHLNPTDVLYRSSALPEPNSEFLC